MNKQVKNLYTIMLTRKHYGGVSWEIVDGRAELMKVLSIDKDGNTKMIHFANIVFAQLHDVGDGMKNRIEYVFSLGAF